MYISVVLSNWPYGHAAYKLLEWYMAHVSPPILCILSVNEMLKPSYHLETVYRAFCIYVQHITNNCIIYLILNCIFKKLQHVWMPQCIILREFLCYAEVACQLKCGGIVHALKSVCTIGLHELKSVFYQ